MTDLTEDNCCLIASTSAGGNGICSVSAAVDAAVWSAHIKENNKQSAVGEKLDLTGFMKVVYRCLCSNSVDPGVMVAVVMVASVMLTYSCWLFYRARLSIFVAHPRDFQNTIHYLPY